MHTLTYACTHTHANNPQTHSHTPGKVQIPVYCEDQGHTPRKKPKDSRRIHTEPCGHTHLQTQSDGSDCPSHDCQGKLWSSPHRYISVIKELTGSMALKELISLCLPALLRVPFPPAIITLHMEMLPPDDLPPKAQVPFWGDLHLLSHWGFRHNLLLEDRQQKSDNKDTKWNVCKILIQMPLRNKSQLWKGWQKNFI